jgi:hypothetical protein
MNVVYIESGFWGGVNLLCKFFGIFAYITYLKASKWRLNVHNVHTFTDWGAERAKRAILDVLLYVVYVYMGLNEKIMAWLLFGCTFNEHWFFNVH